jgi:alkanesulfonate monooxygenase SsuD/methylene tetrahydromethanopterin reductase-like flavin-dependent oxidoreductase (luciferase family)
VTANPEPHHTKFRERSFRRAARLGDGWMVTGFTPDVVAEYLDEIRSYAQEERGEPLPSDYEVAVYYNINVDENREQALQDSKRYLDAYYTTDYARDYLDMWVAMGSPERCIQDIRRFIDAGATTITLRFASYDQQHQYRRVTEEVLPAFF